MVAGNSFDSQVKHCNVQFKNKDQTWLLLATSVDEIYWMVTVVGCRNVIIKADFVLNIWTI